MEGIVEGIRFAAQPGPGRMTPIVPQYFHSQTDLSNWKNRLSIMRSVINTGLAFPVEAGSYNCHRPGLRIVKLR